MPAKNAGRFIASCIETIVNQTFLNWELIVVNDHSTDNTFKIASNYSANDKRIKIVENKGIGIIDALQTGFSYASGDFITRMDADDLMTEDKLQTMHDQLKQNGEGYIATGAVHYFSETSLGEGYKKYANWLNELTAKGNNFTEIYKECVIPSPCWMIHRKDFIKCDGFNSPIYPEDYDLTFRFYKNKLKVIPSTKILHHWRDYSTRTSRTDDNYSDNTFLPLKCSYFLKLDYQPTKELYLWGAGKKGKEIAKILIENKIDFKWICNNPNKIGKEIYGQKLAPVDYSNSLSNSQIIVAFAEGRVKVIDYFIKLQKIKNEDYFLFC